MDYTPFGYDLDALLIIINFILYAPALMLLGYVFDWVTGRHLP